jgi:hypothetical protein
MIFVFYAISLADEPNPGQGDSHQSFNGGVLAVIPKHPEDYFIGLKGWSSFKISIMIQHAGALVKKENKNLKTAP